MEDLGELFEYYETPTIPAPWLSADLQTHRLLLRNVGASESNAPTAVMPSGVLTAANSPQTGPRSGTSPTAVFPSLVQPDGFVLRPSLLESAGQDAVAMAVEDDLLLHPIGTSSSPVTPSFRPQPSTFVPELHENLVPRGLRIPHNVPPVLMDLTNVMAHQFSPPVFPPPMVLRNQVSPASIDGAYVSAHLPVQRLLTAASIRPRAVMRVAPIRAPIRLDRTNYSVMRPQTPFRIPAGF